MQTQQLISLGFGNYVITQRVVSIMNSSSAPMKRIREDARNNGRLIDVTQGRKTRSIIITDSNHVILSAVQPDTLSQRFAQIEED